MAVSQCHTCLVATWVDCLAQVCVHHLEAACNRPDEVDPACLHLLAACHALDLGPDLHVEEQVHHLVDQERHTFEHHLVEQHYGSCSDSTDR